MDLSLAAVLVSGITVLIGVPRGRSWAFSSGRFERGRETRRRRTQRRPTHGGLVLAFALALGSLPAGSGQPAARAVLAAAGVAVLGGYFAEQAKGPSWFVGVSRVGAAIAVPAMGVRVHLTAGPLTDGLVTALVALVLMAGIRSIERSDGTAPAVVGVSAAGILLVAVRIDDPVAPVAAAVVGACLAMVAQVWPPAVVRIGVIGPTVLGAALTAVAVGVRPEIASPRSIAVPVLATLVVVVATLIPSWDRRLRRRGIEPRYALPIASLCGALAADALAGGSVELVPATVIAVVPTTLLAVIGLVTARPRSEGKAPNRNRAVALGAFGVILLGATVGIATVIALGARSSLAHGRDLATDGLDAARSGDLETAQALFEQADDAFADGARSLDNPAVRVAGAIPVIGANLHSARTLASVGGDLSSTAVAVAERAGADDLVVVDGQFPVEASRAVSADLAVALETLTASMDRLHAAGSPLLLDEVREGSDDVADRIGDATESIEVAAEATRLAPALLGADGDRRWMVAILTPSEQRGAGGIAGDFAELRATNGDVDLVRTISASEMNQATDVRSQLDSLPAIYEERYGGYRPGRFWQNLSATPDVPTFARAIGDAFPRTRGGGPIDGVITIDPIGIAALLEITGPVNVPRWMVPIDSENVARVLLFRHYDVLRADQIDSFQGDVVEAVIDKLTTGSLPAPSVLAATLAPAVQGGHLRLWSPEADAEALFERIGADGALRAPSDGTDFVQLLTQSASESKIDWFLRRSLTYTPTVDPTTGAFTATAEVALRNEAPTRGVSSYVIGEADGPTAVGENELRLTLLSPHRPVGVLDAQGQTVPMNVGREQDLWAVTVALEIPAGATATVTFSFEGMLAPTDGTYALRVGRQPAVVPDSVQVHLAGAGGWRPIRAEPADGSLLDEADTAYSGWLERR